MLIVLLPECRQEEDLAQLPLYWWQLERDGQIVSQGQDALSTLKARFPTERLRALAPPMAVSLYRLVMPVRRAAAIRAALPFALEDQLSQDLEMLHCVAGPRRDDGLIAAAVIDDSRMQQWQAWIADSGWRLEALLPLPALHAEQPPASGLRVVPSPWPSAVPLALVTAQDQEPVLIESGLLGLWLKRRLADLPEAQKRVELRGYSAESLGLGSEIEVLDFSGDDAAAGGNAVLQAGLTASLAASPALNLLSGPYAASMAAPPWRKLRPLMVAAGVVLAIVLAQVMVEWLTLSRERDRLVAGIESVFNSSLPNSRMTPFPAEQFRQVLSGATGTTQESGGGFLYEVLSAVKASAGAKVVQFRASPTELDIELQLSSFAELETLRANLAGNSGLSESLQGADSTPEGVTARLKISRSAP
ncbi:MAG: hypothetical protein CVV07_07005 [Gammaproteobacteria bacterium HGW-Gammaproteobacteria-11]|nr:MAG: hypothetical protein CVV07_07005 [Gammaproteobacteria bacterium HGW-Gammaproteobacteria-11]